MCSMVKKSLLGAGAWVRGRCSWSSAPRHQTTSGQLSTRSGTWPKTRSRLSSTLTGLGKTSPTSGRCSIKTRKPWPAPEVGTEHLEREVVTIQANLDKEQKTIIALRDSLVTGDFRLTGHVSDTASDVKAELAHRKDHFDYTSDLLSQKQATLKAKKQIIQAAHEQLENLRTQKSTLLARLANIEARLKMQIEATSVEERV